jgi:S-DNA-T family DNA segregation ATPase FtsK/SpoIIIE
MSRRRTRKSKGTSTLGQLLQGWKPSLQLGPGQLKVLGWVLLILTALTLLGLSGISSGAALDRWASALRRLFGWGAYPLTIGVGLAGLRLVWPKLDEWVSLGSGSVVGLELLLLIILVASHAPLVLRDGADEAFQAAQDGRAGGYVGWALAVPLMEGLGALVGSAVLLAVLIAALALLIPLSRASVLAWVQRQARPVASLFSRSRQAPQVEPVVSEPAEVPWWEQDPDPSEPKRRKPRRRPRRRPATPRPRDGELPPLDLLDPAPEHAYGDMDVHRRTQIIEETLASFGVPTQVVEVNQGPTVTQFGLNPGYVERKVAGGEVQRQRVRVARIASLSSDLALALAAAPIRIEAPVPGKSIVGLEVPNDVVSLVSLRGVMESPDFQRIRSRLAIALGEDVSGHPVSVDLGTMPHLLIAGATGSGKSVCINAIICCLLFNNKPEQLRVLMIDPKMVELIGYDDIPHLIAPVVVEMEQVVGALAWVARQMDERYQLFHKSGTRNLEEYNRRARRRKNEEPLPNLLTFVDELADLMMVAPDEVERYICRLAQMGRATGIHLVIATQRPSVDVVTGLIKANFPARISFAVTSQIDSRVILDQGGAENLLGRGDMLFMSPQQSSVIRLQGCFVSDKEIERLGEYWREEGQEQESSALPWQGMDAQSEPDSLLEQAIQVTEGHDRVSTSFLQRQLRIGFPRAARLMDQLEEHGLVGPDEGGGRGREVFPEEGIDFDEIDERLPGVEPK